MTSSLAALEWTCSEVVLEQNSEVIEIAQKTVFMLEEWPSFCSRSSHDFQRKIERLRRQW